MNHMTYLLEDSLTSDVFSAFCGAKRAKPDSFGRTLSMGISQLQAVFCEQHCLQFSVIKAPK